MSNDTSNKITLWISIMVVDLFNYKISITNDRVQWQLCCSLNKDKKRAWRVQILACPHSPNYITVPTTHVWWILSKIFKFLKKGSSSLNWNISEFQKQSLNIFFPPVNFQVILYFEFSSNFFNFNNPFLVFFSFFPGPLRN